MARPLVLLGLLDLDLFPDFHVIVVVLGVLDCLLDLLHYAPGRHLRQALGLGCLLVVVVVVPAVALRLLLSLGLDAQDLPEPLRYLLEQSRSPPFSFPLSRWSL